MKTDEDARKAFDDAKPYRRQGAPKGKKLQENGQAEGAPEDKAKSGAKPTALPGLLLDWPALVGLTPPPRKWIVRGWIPAGVVTLIHGYGGVGKSLLVQQILTAAAFRRELLGSVADACPVLGWWGEDDHDELWRRQLDINAMLGIEGGLGAVAGKLFWRTCPGEDITLFEGSTEDKYQTTPRYDQLAEEIQDTKVALTTLDSLSQVAAIPEANRALVTRALQALTRLCIATGTTIVLIGHNNRTGDFSGSSAWENSARSRIHVKIEKDEETKIERTLLAKPKANYAEREDGVMIAWHKGAFRFSDQRFETYGDQLERQMRDRKIDATFLSGLDQLVERQITTSVSKQAQNYAPKVMSMHAVNGEFTVHDLEAAMRRLLAEGMIIGDTQLWQKGNRHWACGLGRKPVGDDATPAADEGQPLADSPFVEPADPPSAGNPA